MARLVFDRYRVGPHGSYGYHRAAPGQGACPGGYPCDHWGVDYYPTDLREPVKAPERCQVVAVRLSSAAGGALQGYGPGALRVVSLGLPSSLVASWRVWHTLGHLEPSELGAYRVGQVLDEGQPIARVYAPASGGWRHCHHEIWKRAAVPSGTTRRPYTCDPVQWVREREAAMAAAVVAGVVVAGAVSR